MKKFFTFISGLAVGSAVALLLAPEKGEDTRKKVKAKAKEMGHDLDEYTAVGKEKWDEYKEVGTMKANEWKVAAEEALENATKKVNGNTDATI